MITPSSRRTVQLIDARDSEHKLVLADVYRDFPSAELEHIETIWEQARDMAMVEGPAGGLTPFEHAHWDWRNKVHSVEAGRHMLVSVECDGQVQGLMAVLRSPQRSRPSPTIRSFTWITWKRRPGISGCYRSRLGSWVSAQFSWQTRCAQSRHGPGGARWPAFAPPSRGILPVPVRNDWVRSGLKLF